MPLEEFGVVLRTNGRLAEVSIRQHSACAKCGKCDLSHESKDLTVSAVNRVGAVPGARVSLQMAHRDLISAGLIVYGLPLVALFVGVGVGQTFFSQLGAAVCGFLGLGLTYGLIHWRFEPRLKASERYNITITRIIDEEEVHL